MITLWNKTDRILREHFKFRALTSFYCIIIILAHVFENNLTPTYFHFVTLTIALINPFATLYFCARSKDPWEAALNATIMDLFWCGVFIASIDYSYIPSLVLFLVCLSNYFTARGFNKIYRLLLIPLGFVPVILFQGFIVIQGKGLAENITPTFFGIMSFSILGDIVHRISRARKEKQKELAESNAVKDRLLSIIAHDIKSPLNSLKGFLSLIESKSITKDEEEALVKKLSNHFNHTSELIENVLQWAGSQINGITMQKELVDIKPISAKAIELLQSQAAKKEIVIENSIQSHSTFADPNMIELVFRNLLSNAVKFTDRNGKIKLYSAPDNQIVTFCVEDNGVGISNESILKLFRIDKTYATLGTEKEKGSGLGLSLCKDFIKRHGGRLWVESELGKGTKFYFTLPQKKE